MSIKRSGLESKSPKGRNAVKNVRGRVASSTRATGAIRAIATKHDCDKIIRNDQWAWSGYRQPGQIWTCTCGKQYSHICDEADGCSWEPVSK